MTPTRNMLHEFTKRRTRVMELVQSIPMIKCSEPKGAFYVFPEVDQYFGRSDGTHIINDADDLCMYFLNTANVSTVTGRAFGAPNCIRISFANSMENIERGFEKIRHALEKLK